MRGTTTVFVPSSTTNIAPRPGDTKKKKGLPAGRKPDEVLGGLRKAIKAPKKSLRNHLLHGPKHWSCYHAYDCI